MYKLNTKSIFLFQIVLFVFSFNLYFERCEKFYSLIVLHLGCLFLVMEKYLFERTSEKFILIYKIT